MRRILPIIAALFILLYVFLLNRNNTSLVSAELASHVVISEIQISGGGDTSVTTDEFVELYNPTGSSVDLTGWHLMRKTSGGVDPILVATLSGSIASHGFFLIAHTNYDGAVNENQTYDSENIASNNTVILHSDGLGDVDKVGMGTASDFEGTDQTSSPANNRSIERKAFASSLLTDMVNGGAHALAGNGEDSDDNAADFVYRTTVQGADPQNASSPIETPTEVTPSVTPTPSEEPTQTPTPTEELTSTPTPTVESTSTPTPTEEPTNTPTPTSEPTQTPTSSPTPTEILEPTSTPTASPTPTEELTNTPTPTPKFFSVPTPPSPKIFYKVPLLICDLKIKEMHVGFLTFRIPFPTCKLIQ